MCIVFTFMGNPALNANNIVLFMYRTFPIHRIKILPACSNYSFPHFRRGQIKVLKQRKPRVGVQIAHFTQSQLQYTVAIRATTLTSSAHMRTLSSILHVIWVLFSSFVSASVYWCSPTIKAGNCLKSSSYAVNYFLRTRVPCYAYEKLRIVGL